MPDAGFALRKAVVARLLQDAALTGLLGQGRVFDEVPRAGQAPYLVLGEGSVRDWSSASDRGHEHRLTLAVWSKEGGAKEALAIADAAVTALESLPVALDGHRLVNLIALDSEVRREADRRLLRAIIRLRAVTEVV
jgi:hypothetical protein